MIATLVTTYPEHRGGQGRPSFISCEAGLACLAHFMSPNPAKMIIAVKTTPLEAQNRVDGTLDCRGQGSDWPIDQGWEPASARRTITTVALEAVQCAYAGEMIRALLLVQGAVAHDRLSTTLESSMTTHTVANIQVLVL